MTVSVTASDGTNNISKSTSVAFFDPNAGGGTIPATCSDGTKTVKVSPIMRVFDGLPVLVDPFGKNQTAVYTMVVPAANAGQQFVFSWASFGGTSDQIYRRMWISKTPCDLSKASQVASGKSFSGAINGVLNDGTSVVTGATGNNTIHVQTGETWYIMVQNLNFAGSNSCSQADCPMVIKPQPVN